MAPDERDRGAEQKDRAGLGVVHRCHGSVGRNLHMPRLGVCATLVESDHIVDDIRLVVATPRYREWQRRSIDRSQGVGTGDRGATGEAVATASE